MNYNRNITKNFKWYEFFQSDLANELNINNYTKDINILSNIIILCNEILQPVRDIFGPIRITSGYRCKELNDELSSSNNSDHRYGFAADFESDNIKLLDIIIWIHNNLKYKEMIAEYLPQGWIHIAYQTGWNNKILKYKEYGSTYKIITPEKLIKKYKY